MSLTRYWQVYREIMYLKSGWYFQKRDDGSVVIAKFSEIGTEEATIVISRPEWLRIARYMNNAKVAPKKQEPQQPEISHEHSP